MKKIIFSVISILTYSLTYAQTTATDFTINDCAGNPHHLFEELEAGKIIVIAFVMPCGACAAPSLAAYNAVQSYATSNPNTVLFYLSDDNGTTSCSTISNFGSSNGMTNATSFSNTALNQNQYGGGGMPKIVVLGGTNHAVLSNQNSGVTTSGIQQTINLFLASAGNEEINSTNGLKAKAFPNPSKNDVNIEYSLDKTSNVQIEIYSIKGELVFQSKEINKEAGNHKFVLSDDEKIENGMYVFKITSDSKTETINFIVEK